MFDSEQAAVATRGKRSAKTQLAQVAISRQQRTAAGTHALDIWPVCKVIPFAGDQIRAVQVGQGSVKQVARAVNTGMQPALLLVYTHGDSSPGGSHACFASDFTVVLNRAVILAVCYVVDGKRPAIAAEHTRVGRLSTALRVKDLRAVGEHGDEWIDSI
jgi:hypothetical protein